MAGRREFSRLYSCTFMGTDYIKALKSIQHRIISFCGVSVAILEMDILHSPPISMNMSHTERARKKIRGAPGGLHRLGVS